jgi:membrane fusion protein, multidrug efflux system
MSVERRGGVGTSFGELEHVPDAPTDAIAERAPAISIGMARHLQHRVGRDEAGHDDSVCAEVDRYNPALDVGADQAATIVLETVQVVPTGRRGRRDYDPAMSRRGDSTMRILVLTAIAAALFLAACQPAPESSAPEPRPVRTVTVAKRDIGETVSFTGRIEAENETRLSFRIGGRMIERSANVGGRVDPGQVVARLEPQNELNALRSSQAAVAAAQAQFNEAKANYGRQKFLLARDVASRVQYERAEQTQETARAQLDSAEAQLKIAQDQVGDTELKADAGGIVIGTAAEPGEVVQAGQLIIRVAPKGGRDAVFDVPGQVLRSAPSEPLVTVSLTDDPAVTTVGRVREASPQADPVTRTFEVKVGLTDPPAAMRLGATVIGQVQLDAAPTIEIPATALTEFDRRSAVWVVDPSSLTVSLRNVDILRHNPATAAISNGLDTGEIVVTAGAQALHPGQKIRLLGSAR